MYSLSSQALNFEKLNLSAKKLLYSCDVNIFRNNRGLCAEGDIRFGPFTSKIEIQTELDEHFRFINYEIKAPTLKFWQKYKYEDGLLCFTRSKDEEKRVMEEQNLQWWDPLSLLLQVRYDYMNNSLKEVYHTFSKNKFSPLQTDRGTNYCRLLKNKSPLVSLSQISEQLFSIKVDKLKAELNLSAQ